MRILSALSFIIALIAGAFAAYLYWEHEYGSCKDGCPEGMVFALFTPAILVFVSGALIGLILRFVARRTCVDILAFASLTLFH